MLEPNVLTDLQILSNFDSNPFICDSILFLGKNSPNIANSNLVFPGKGKGDRVLILTYLDGPMADVFPFYCLFFLFWPTSGKSGWSKLH